MLKGQELDEEADERSVQGLRIAVQGSSADRLQPGDSDRHLRLHHHRRVPPLDLQSLAPGAGVFRRPSDRPHGDAVEADLRLLQSESRDGVQPRARGRRRRQRRLRRLSHPDRDHRARRQDRRRLLRRQARPPDAQETLGAARRRLSIRRQAARPRRGRRGPDPHGAADLSRQAVHGDLSRPRPTCPRR